MESSADTPSCTTLSTAALEVIPETAPRNAIWQANRKAHSNVRQSPRLKLIPAPGVQERTAAPTKQVNASGNAQRAGFWRKSSQLMNGTIMTLVAVRKAEFAGVVYLIPYV